MSFFKSKTFHYGVPFLVLVVGGSFGLKEFTELRYTYRQRQTYLNLLDKAGITLKDPSEVTLEKEYEKIQKLDLDNWENVRIPRPWDESIDTK